MIHRARRGVRAGAAALGLAAALAACAPALSYPAYPSPQSLPPGSPLTSRTLDQGDAWLRHYLMTGEYDEALKMLDRSSKLVTRDRLLRQLQSGIVLHYAGRYEESNRAFDAAEREADQRYTKSMREAAGSLLLNDKVLAYVPSPAEMAVIPYYRMLNYLALGQMDGGVVEARKAGAYVARIERESGRKCSGNAFVQYLSGLVYDAAGERNDALVSLRQAERSFASCSQAGSAAPPEYFGSDLLRLASLLGVEEVMDAAASRYGSAPEPDPTTAGDLVVLIENGFVAHRAHRDLYVPILPGEMEGLESGEVDEIAAVAARITSRLISNFTEQTTWGTTLDSSPFVQASQMAEGAYVLKLAWPVARLEANRAASFRVVVNDQVVEAPPVEDVSSLFARELESQRSHIVARMVARGLVKYVVANEAERKAEKKGGEVLGFLTGIFANAATNALEQADTRSWSLLPDQISMARLRLPPGEHDVRIDVLGSGGMVVRTLDLGRVTVRPGERVFRSRRVWGPEVGDRDRLTRLQIGLQADAPQRRSARSRWEASGTSPSGSAPGGSSGCRRSRRSRRPSCSRRGVAPTRAARRCLPSF
ncbi:MAG TPA: hypothetical protein VGR27_02640, partial [Longimicrobiaceae bacterium]|nr:hypothetical protein [Longimicrobiaceae bacterium]